jgi:hypothetical protein
MAGRGDEMAAGAAGRGRLRASHADREQVIGTLKAAFVQGMLAKDEFDLRVGQAFAARTYAELAAVTASIPAVAGPDPAQPLEPAWAQDQQPVLRPGPVIMAATVLCAGVWGVALLTVKGDNNVAATLVAMATLTYFLVLLIAGGHLLALRHDKRSRRQRPRRPAPGGGGQASQRPPSAGPAGQLPPIDHGQQHTAEAAHSRLPRLRLSGSRSPRRWRSCGLLAVGGSDRRAISVQLGIADD